MQNAVLCGNVSKKKKVQIFNDKEIYFMVFNVVFNSSLVISLRPVPPSMLF